MIRGLPSKIFPLFISSSPASRCLCTAVITPHSLELSIISALKSASSSISYGHQLHCRILKSGLHSNLYINNSLINMYSKAGHLSSAKSIFDCAPALDLVACNIMLAGYMKCGYPDDAYHLFAKMPVRNCVSYTTLIMGLGKNERYLEAIRLFREMLSSGIVPGDVTMASIISAYARCEDGNWELAKSLHGFVLKLGLLVPVIVSTNLVHLYCMSSCLDNARIIFDDMEEKNVVTWNALLNGYVKVGSVRSARSFFDLMPEKDVISWGTMIDGYVKVGRLKEALKLYTVMRHSGLIPNEVMIVDIISACAEDANFVEGQQFHLLALKLGFKQFDFMQATLINFYAACHEIELALVQFEEGNKDHIATWNALMAGFIRNERVDDARTLFEEMPGRDVFSWSTMISGYSQTGLPSLALGLFHKMIADGIKPNEITMIGVLSAIASLGTLNEGRQAHNYIIQNSIPITNNLTAAIVDMYAKCGSIDLALETFDQIRETTNFTDVSPWNAIICGLAMHGHAELCLNFFSKMKRQDIRPNAITFIGVLSACCHAGLVEVGEEHFNSMKSSYALEPNIKHYGCMVDLLGRAGRLNEAEQLIKAMPMEADVIIWGMLLAACRMHGNTDIGERAAKNLTTVEPSHGPSRVLLSNMYANAGRWGEAMLVRDEMRRGKLSRSPGYSGVA